MQDWDTLRVILAVAREGTLMGAARKLDISVATVSRKIGRAEEDLNAKLFDRRHKGIYTTEQGDMAVETATIMEEQVNGLHTRLDASSGDIEGHLRLSLPLSVLPYGFADDLRAFRDQHPNVVIDVNATDSPVDFEERQADVVMRVAENPPSSLWGFRIATVGVSFFASTEFMQHWGPQMQVDPETVRLPYIELATANPAADRDEILARFPSAKVYARCEGMESLIPMVRAGLGVGRMMRYMAAGFSDLEKLFDCDEQWSRSVWLLTHRDLNSTRRIRTFIEFMRTRFEERGFQF